MCNGITDQRSSAVPPQDIYCGGDAAGDLVAQANRESMGHDAAYIKQCRINNFVAMIDKRVESQLADIASAFAMIDGDIEKHGMATALGGAKGQLRCDVNALKVIRSTLAHLKQELGL
jgi:hypothetical protein